MTNSTAMHFERFGSGRPLVLIHGLGSCWLNWAPILPALAEERDVIAVDLPGHGTTAAQTKPSAKVTIASLADDVTCFLATEGLETADLVGSSMGARLVLELARRGVGGNVVALDPGGFWKAGERRVFATSVGLSVKLVRALQPWMPAITASPIGRTLLMAQFSAHPWRLDPALVLAEMRSFAIATTLDDELDALAHGPDQAGADKTPGRVTFGWGVYDRVTVRSQAARALDKFPSATLRWFNDCGHFPHWDQPDAASRFILRSTS